MRFIVVSLLVCQLFAGFTQSVESDQIDQDLIAMSAALLTLMDSEQGLRDLKDLPMDVQPRYIAGSGIVLVAPLGPEIGMSFFHGASDDEMIMTVADRDEYFEKKEQKTRDYVDAAQAASLTFLTEYGSLLRDFDPSEGVVIKAYWMKHHPQLIKKEDPNRIVKGIEIAARISDVLDLDAGEIDEETLIDRINILELPEAKPNSDMEVFGSILRKLMNENNTETYFITSMPRFDHLSTIGITYDIEVYSSYVDGNRFSMPSVDQKNLSQVDRDAIVEDLYPQFLQEFKTHVVQYGHILKTMTVEESIVFRIRLSKCKGCSIPERIQLSVKKSILSDYRNGEIEFEQAMEAFNLQTL